MHNTNLNKTENTPTIETERLILRRFSETDLLDLFEIYRDEATNEFLPWYPIKTIEEAKSFFNQQYLDYYKLKKGYRYAICLKSDNKPIGYIQVSMEESHNLGYGLCKKVWHQGIATEACRAIIKQVKQDGLTYLTATHDVNNPRSGEVMKQLGMLYQYSYQEQWQPKNKSVVFRLYQLNFNCEEKFIYLKYWNQSAVHFIESIGDFISE